MKQPFHLTQVGVDELKSELSKLVASRLTIAEAISLAREHGDLSENAEYQAAKQEQERIENRIKEIENILKHVTVIEQPKQVDTVQLGSTVELKNVNDKRQVAFSIVGTVEANPFKGKLSDESPIGQALLGKAVGDEVEIACQDKQSKYVIETIK